MIKLARDFTHNGIELKSFVGLAAAQSETVRCMRNHPSIRRWMYNRSIIGRSEHESFISGLGKDLRNFYWLVYRCGTPLGVVYLNRVNDRHRHAYLGIYAAPSCPPGTGSHLLEALCMVAFRRAGLRTLKLEVLASNTKALSFYAKNGFKIEGRLRDFVRRGASWEDVVIMGKLR